MERFVLSPVFATSVAYTDPAGRDLQHPIHYVWMGCSQDAIRDLYLMATGIEERHDEPRPIDITAEDIFGLLLAHRSEEVMEQAVRDYNIQHGECAILVLGSRTPFV